jgi:hypothetical protein
LGYFSPTDMRSLQGGFERLMSTIRLNTRWDGLGFELNTDYLAIQGCLVVKNNLYDYYDNIILAAWEKWALSRHITNPIIKGEKTGDELLDEDGWRYELECYYL